MVAAHGALPRYARAEPGSDMGELDKEVIRECRAVALEKCLNKSRGGEGIHRRSVRFCYIAVRYRRGHEL